MIDVVNYDLVHNVETVLYYVMVKGRSWISEKGVQIFKGVGVCFADLIPFFLNMP